MNTRLIRWLVGITFGLAVLQIGLSLLWGRGQVVLILPWYSVLTDSVPILEALAISVVAFGQYRVLRNPVPFWAGIATSQFAIFALFDALTAPSVLSDHRSILGRLPNTSSWFWHLMFSTLAVFLIVAIVSRWPHGEERDRFISFRLAILLALGSIVFCWLSVAFEQNLPLLVSNQTWTMLNVIWVWAILVGFIVGTALSARQYFATRSTPCAYLAMSQLVLAFALVADLGGSTMYSQWWYWQRVLWLGSFSVVLFGFIFDYIRLFSIERERTHQLATLERITNVLVHELELMPIAQVIVDQCISVLHVDGAAIWLADRTRRELIMLASRGASPVFDGVVHCVSFDAPTLSAEVARTEELQVVENLENTDHVDLDRDLYRREGFQSLLGVPLCARGHLVAVVAFANRQPRHFGPSDMSFITTLAALFAVVIENAQLYADTRRTLRLREEFMAAAAHELRTPLTVIQGRAQLTLKVDAQEEPARLAFEDILHASQRINRLIEDLIAVLRVRPGSLNLRLEKFDLGSLVRVAAEQAARSAMYHEFRTVIDGPLPVVADRALVLEVLNRLLENAMRYTPGGGQIVVEAQRQGSQAVVSVSDNGLGIPLERQPYVFEPFYELIPGGVKGYVGLVSLGLYLSKEVLEAQGGRIWFTSTPSKGSTFCFSLPLHFDPQLSSNSSPDLGRQVTGPDREPAGAGPRPTIKPVGEF